MPRSRSLFNQASWIFAGKASGFLVAFWIPIILVRLLSPEQFGGYKQFFLVSMTIVSALPLGLEASLFYFMPGDRKNAATYFRQTALTLFVMGALAGLVLVALAEPLARLLNAPIVAALAPALAIYVLFEIGGQLLAFTVVIERQSGLAALVFLLSDVARAAALVIPVWVTGELFWLGVGAAAYAVLRSIGLVAWGLWTFRDVPSKAFDTELLKGQIRYALPFGASTFLDEGLRRFHQFFVSASFSPALFAVYSVGLHELAPVTMFFSSLFDVVMVRMSELFAEDGQLSEIRRLWARMLSGQALLVVPLFVILWALAPEFIVGLFTEQYVDSVPVFRVALFTLLLTMVNDHAVLRSCALTGFIFKATAVGLLASLVAVPALAAVFGLPGAAGGFVAGWAVAKGLGLWRICKRIELPLQKALPWGALLRYGAAAAAVSLAVSPTKGLFEGPLVTFFFTGGLFWVVYGVVVWAGRLAPVEDRELLGRALAPFRSRFEKLRGHA
ncbi:MAG: oligosaccharide flippase family protein [Gemmatimonadetes bacterium]|nr:oligosaccharide flippase family protein [Gemmatimonadota bacterium]